MESAGVFIAKGSCAGTLNDFFGDHLATVRRFDRIPGMIKDRIQSLALGQFWASTRRWRWKGPCFLRSGLLAAKRW
jgi:hypothetical protein